MAKDWNAMADEGRSEAPSGPKGGGNTPLLVLVVVSVLASGAAAFGAFSASNSSSAIAEEVTALKGKVADLEKAANAPRQYEYQCSRFSRDEIIAWATDPDHDAEVRAAVEKNKDKEMYISTVAMMVNKEAKDGWRLSGNVGQNGINGGWVCFEREK